MIGSIFSDAGTALIAGSFTALGMHYFEPFDLPNTVIKASIIAGGIFLSNRFAKATGGEVGAIGSGIATGVLFPYYPGERIQLALIGLASSIIPGFLFKGESFKMDG